MTHHSFTLSPTLAGVTCFACDTPHDPRQLLTVCTSCGLPLRVDYDLSRVKVSLADLRDRPPTLWRYLEVLPVHPDAAVTLMASGCDTTRPSRARTRSPSTLSFGGSSRRAPRACAKDPVTRCARSRTAASAISYPVRISLPA